MREGLAGSSEKDLLVHKKRTHWLKTEKSVDPREMGLLVNETSICSSTRERPAGLPEVVSWFSADEFFSTLKIYI